MEDQTSADLSPLPQRRFHDLPQISSYVIHQKLQVGGQASVYLAEKGQSQYALKVYRQGAASAKEFRNEIGILSELNFRGIVPIVQTVEDTILEVDAQEPTSANIIVTPFFTNGDLLEFIRKRGPMKQDCCRFFAKTLFSTFLYLHSKNIFHGDIKAENIIFGNDFKPLLLDFGFSIRTGDKRCHFIGDIRYASPQVIKRIGYTFESEVYSLGVILFYCLSGCFPFTAARVSDPCYRLLLQKKEEAFWQRIQQRVRVDFSETFKELFLKMIRSNPKNRCTLEQAVDMGWFKLEAHTSETYQKTMQSSPTLQPLKDIYFN